MVCVTILFTILDIANQYLHSKHHIYKTLNYYKHVYDFY